MERWPFVGRDVELAAALDVVLDPTMHGVVVVGDAGVGRTRFAEELVAEVERSGLRVARVTADSTSSALPLGAFAHLLAPEVILSATGDRPLDPTRLLAQARRVLGGHDDRLVLMIDDAQLLDAVSLTLLMQLLHEGRTAVVATVRSGEPRPDALGTLWRGDSVRRVDLGPLDDAAVDRLLQLGLGGPVEGRAERALRVSSGGNPLLLRELARAAETDGVLVQVDGVWSLTGTLPTRHRAAELLYHRVAAVEGDPRIVLELLAVVGASELTLVIDRFGPDVVDLLESDGLVSIRLDAGRGAELVALAHPLLIDAVRATISTVRRRAILRAHAAHVATRERRLPADVLRVAAWQLEAGDRIEPGLAEAAATLARHAGDFSLTLRLAEALHEARPTMRTAILLGEALYETGSWEAAEAVLAGAETMEGTPAEVLRLVGQRGTNLLFGLLDPESARRITDDAAPQFLGDAHAALRDELVSRRALLHVYDGQPAMALEILEALDGRDREVAPSDPTTGLDPDVTRAQIMWATPGVTALALSGRTGEAIDLAQKADALHARLDDDIGLTSPETHLLTLCLALQEHGSLDDAASLAQAGYDSSVEAGSLPGQTWFALNLSRIALIRARPVSCERWCRESASVAASVGWLGPRSMALAGLAASTALAGDMVTAHQALVDLAAIAGRFGFLLPERCIGPAWVLVAQGRRTEAIETFVAGADLAAATGHVTTEAWLLHEVARIGGGAEVVDRIEALAARCDGTLVAARAADTRARVSGDVEQLVCAADAFEAMGCHLVAAESLRLAADRARADGDRRRANGLASRSRAAAESTEGARSDDLLVLDVVVPLTKRERDVAMLAATGVQSQEIADRLFLSVRTVSNHLQNIYTKLGVSGRAELASALTSSVDPVDPNATRPLAVDGNSRAREGLPAR
ncbi:MAG: LuxR C-terminal-related transcriptional regulator [Ilumatobacter sp.]|uniref:helix-turn-helix transcriptional regulator n=1 Tax=Ilumatobacter sp. TaxID=1967498 RepID=UPI00329859FC